MNVLLLDTSFAAAPIYDYLVSQGHNVWVMGNRASDLLALRAGERWIEQNYSDCLEVARHVEAVGIEAIVPGCTDVSIETCLSLNVGAEFRDSKIVNAILSNKARFRDLCDELGLSAPRKVNESRFPLPGKFICKPVDSFSGRGITIFDGEDREATQEALSLAKSASPSGQAILETYAQGQLYSCSAFIEDRAISEMFLVREGSSANPYAVDTSHLAHDVPEKNREVLRNDVNKICEKLDLKDGLFHIQFILSDTSPMIIEVTRRCPGDLYSLLIELSTGFEYAARYAAAFLGQKHPTNVCARRHILRHTVTSDRNAHFEGLIFQGNVPVCAFYPISALGEALKERQANRAGLLFCEEKDEHELYKLYDLFLNRSAYSVSN